MIESYKFGVIVIDGKKYTSDIIVSSERVNHSWWRKEGHKLQVEDLDEILEHETEPEVIVLGTGFYGFMKIASDIEDLLESRGIELVTQLTSMAIQTYNKLANEAERRKIVGAFHLTC